MAVHVSTHVLEANIRKMFADPKGQPARGMLKMAKRVERKAKRLVRVDKGRLRASITSHVIIRGGVPVGRIGTNVKYALFVHNGTGIYGPKRRPITPKNGKVLAWKGKGPKGIVFARSVKGMRPNPFLKDALKVLQA